MAWTTGSRVMKLRARYRSVDIIVETLDGWRRHMSGRNASLLAFFTFLSIFPLMLAATTILGLVLQDDPELQRRIVNGAVSEIPVLGSQLREDAGSLNGSVWVLVGGLLGALWSSTKAFVGLQGALDDVWEVPIDDRAGMPVQRGRAIVGILILGLAQIGNIVIAAAVDATGLPGISQFLIALPTVLLNIVVLAAMFRFLTSAEPTWGDVWPGSIVAGIAFSILQQFGPRIVDRITENASDTYGTFAVVLGLVTWLSLIAISALMAAELNAALVRRRDGVTPALGDDFDLPVRPVSQPAS
ncbi:MAG: YihY/virulence factor BrkB family protein [Ilumatobacter sp.]|nr:YihY/virulence factor BrkB family protein [Ilumatobacter sp.]